MAWWSKKTNNTLQNTPQNTLPISPIYSAVCGGIAVNEYYWKVMERRAKLEKIKKSIEDEK